MKKNFFTKYLKILSQKFSRRVKKEIPKKVWEINNLLVFNDNSQKFILRTSKSSGQAELVNLENKRKIKKLLIGKNKKTISTCSRWKNICFSKISTKQYLLSYETLSKKKITTNLLSSSNLTHWKKIKSTQKIKGACFFLPNKNNKKPGLFLFGKKKIQLASFKKTEKKSATVILPRKGFFDENTLYPANVFEKIEGFLVFYYAQDNNQKFSVGAILLDKESPEKILWQTDLPLWKQPTSQIFNPLGIIKSKERYFLYLKNDKGNVYEVGLPPIIYSKIRIEKNKQTLLLQPQLKRAKNNPILFPINEHHWESEAVFNPASIYIDGRVHLVYRAIGRDGISMLGYASSKNGVDIDERLKEPIYIPSQYFEFRKNTQTKTASYPYVSGGGWGGCEDPRLTVVGKNIYMTYIAFNGHTPPGVAITSIKISDFLKKNWKWKTPRLISRPGEIQKNWVVFPEKIRGKYAILHSIAPDVMIDYFDSLGNKEIIIDSFRKTQSDDRRWDNILRGVAAPPIKTDYGWLVLYHAMDKRDPNRYKVGAMLLDYKNPEKILHRCHQPILEPILHYENEGFKSGVVYVCGTVIKDNKLFVYYGGADKFVCVASAPIKKFLHALINSPETISFKKINK